MCDRKRILKNCRSSSGWQGVDFNVNEERLFDMLDTARAHLRGENGRSIKALLEEMEDDDWMITAGIHGGGIGGGGRQADPRDHITVRTSRRTYHVRLHSSGRSIIEVTT
jgi:hypothetical protein